MNLRSGILDTWTCVWFLVALCACLSVVEGRIGNCTSIPTIELAREGILYRINTTGVAVHPVSQGIVLEQTFVFWGMDVFIEREKINHTWSGQLPQAHGEIGAPRAKQPLLERADPFEPYVYGTNCTGYWVECGPILFSLKPEEMDCSVRNFTAPYHGVQRESVYITYTTPVHPDFMFVAEHHLVDKDIVVPKNNPGYPIEEEYYKNSLKIAYEWINIPWQGSDDIALVSAPTIQPHNGSTFEFWVDMELSFPDCREESPCVFSLINDRLYKMMTVSSKSPPVDLMIDWLNVFQLNNIGWPASWFHGSTLDAIDLDPFEIKEPLHFRPQMSLIVSNSSFGHFANFSFDPHLGALFTSLARTPQSNKLNGKFPAWGAALIAIGIVSIAVIALGAMYMVWKMNRYAASKRALKSKRHKPSAELQPLSSPSSTPSSTSPSGATSNGWARATAPST